MSVYLNFPWSHQKRRRRILNRSGLWSPQFTQFTAQTLRCSFSFPSGFVPGSRWPGPCQSCCWRSRWRRSGSRGWPRASTWGRTRHQCEGTWGEGGSVRVRTHIHPHSTSQSSFLSCAAPHLSVMLVSSMHFSSRDFSYCQEPKRQRNKGSFYTERQLFPISI